MRVNDIIYLVYGQKKISDDSSYFVLQLFSNQRSIDREFVVKSYESEVDTWRMPDWDSRVGPFESLESLQKFSFNLCQRSEANKIILLSIDAYNEAVEKSSQIEELWNCFAQHGDVIDNVDGGGRGIFDRLFN